MPKRTRQEHHIPQKSYLDYFVDKENKDLLWVYEDKRKVINDVGSVQPKNISTSKFCREAYFYESPLYPINAIEKVLSEIEGKYKNVLENKVLERKKLTTKEKEIVSYFISTLEMRTTASRQNINSFIDRVSEHFTALEKQYKDGEMTENHKQLLEQKEKNTAFSQTVALSIEVNRWRFADFEFMFVGCPDGDDQFLITSDHPVTLYDFTLMNSIYGIPPLSTTAEVVIPLSPYLALLVNNVGAEGYREIGPNFVREINNRVIISSNRYIISPKKITPNFMGGCTSRFRQSFLLLTLNDTLRKEWEKRHKKYQQENNNKEEHKKEK